MACNRARRACGSSARAASAGSSDGPFAETKELIAGYALWQVKSREEAVEWLKRCPDPTKGDWSVELRQVFEPTDFGEEFTREVHAKEAALRAQSANRK